MKPRLSSCLLLAAAWAVPAPVFTAEAAPGKASLNVRVRYEEVSQSGLKEAEALTLRTRLGYTLTALPGGLTAMVEAENITSPSGDRYSQAGINPGGAGRAIVADPETTEINQAWLAWQRQETTATLGRQRLVLDNARFIGDVGWRQNMQTFDAVVVQDKTLPKTTLTYGWIGRVNRVFGDDHPQGNWDSDSHVFNASYRGLHAGTLTAYAYLLDFANAAAQSSATYGAAFAGATALDEGLKLTYRLEAATQSDHGASPLHYSTSYTALELGVEGRPGALVLGYERLGSDGNGSFRTPLATLHAYNGWADLFLSTPANGLADTYARASATLPGEIAIVAVHHWYQATRGGADYGTEFNLQVSRKFGTHVTGTAKYARFQRDSVTFPDVDKLWLQVEVTY